MLYAHILHVQYSWSFLTFPFCVLSLVTLFHFILLFLPFSAIFHRYQRYPISHTHQVRMSMYTTALIHGNKKRLWEWSGGKDDMGKRQNRSGRDAWYPPMALDCKTLQLPPPSLAVFFLIASLAIFGGHLKWELWGEGVEEERFCAYACVCACVSGKGGHLVLLRQWISTLIGSRVAMCVRACACIALLLLETREETHTNTRSHKHMHKSTLPNPNVEPLKLIS